MRVWVVSKKKFTHWCLQVEPDPAAEGWEGTRAAEHSQCAVLPAQLWGGQSTTAGSAVRLRHCGRGLQLFHPADWGREAGSGPERDPGTGGQDCLPEERCQDVCLRIKLLKVSLKGISFVWCYVALVGSVASGDVGEVGPIKGIRCTVPTWKLGYTVYSCYNYKCYFVKQKTIMV